MLELKDITLLAICEKELIGMTILIKKFKMITTKYCQKLHRVSDNLCKDIYVFVLLSKLRQLSMTNA